MPELKKIETASDVANYTPPEGYVVVFQAVENGVSVTKIKDSAGTVYTQGGGSSGGLTAAQAKKIATKQSLIFG